MSEKTYTKAETQTIANQIRKQILGIALKTGGCYLAQACSSAEIISMFQPSTLNFSSALGLMRPTAASAQ